MNFNIIMTEDGSLLYEIQGSDCLSGIEIKDSLSKVKFYVSDDSLTFNKISRIENCVLTAKLPEIGSLTIEPNYVAISYMQAFSDMGKLSRKCIEENFIITDELHILEIYLKKFLDANLIDLRLYENIRTNVRNRNKQLQRCAEENENTYMRAKQDFLQSYIPNPNFVAIKRWYEVDKFAGKVIVYQASPLDDSLLPTTDGTKLNFARIPRDSTQWRDGQTGYPIHYVIDRQGTSFVRGLVDSKLNKEPFMMRLATSQELSFLITTVELGFGQFEGSDYIQISTGIFSSLLEYLSSMKQTYNTDACTTVASYKPSTIPKFIPIAGSTQNKSELTWLRTTNTSSLDPKLVVLPTEQTDTPSSTHARCLIM